MVESVHGILRRLHTDYRIPNNEYSHYLPPTGKLESTTRYLQKS